MSGLRAGLILALLAAAAAAAPQEPPVKREDPAVEGGEAQKKEPADAAAMAKLKPAERAVRLTAAIAHLAEEFAGVKTLTASFVQRKHLEVFGGMVESRGSLALVSPDKFVWKTDSPLVTELIVAGDKGLRRRTSRRGAVTETAFDLSQDPVTATTVQQVILFTRGDFAGAKAGYELELVSELPLVVRATPRHERMRKVIRSVQLTFSKKPRHLEQVVLTEETGDRTEITFSDVKRNATIPAERFDVTPRPGR